MERQRQRLGPPPVDALSDVAWARVERNVLNRTSGTITHAAAAKSVVADRRNNWVWLAVPAAAAAAFGFAFFSMNSGSGTPATNEDEPSRIVASASPTTVSFGDAHVTLAADSALVMDQNAKKTGLLEHGTATFAVAPRGDRGPFTLLAGDTLVRTTSAKFKVTREGELAKVSVETGSVEIRFRGNEVTVDSDHAWSSEHPADIIKVDRTPEEKL